jgi:hypothetical protein
LSQYRIVPENPQPRLIRQAAQILRDGGLITYPTTAALGCHIEMRRPERIAGPEMRTVTITTLGKLIRRDGRGAAPRTGSLPSAQPWLF